MKTVAQLEADKTAVAAKLKTRMDAVMRASEEHVVTAATATTPAVVGRTWTPEERAELEALAAEGRAIKAQIDARQGDANLMAEYNRLTEGMAAAAADGNAQRQVRVRGSIGQQFIADPAYQAWVKGGQHKRQGVGQVVDPVRDQRGGIRRIAARDLRRRQRQVDHDRPADRRVAVVAMTVRMAVAVAHSWASAQFAP